MFVRGHSSGVFKVWMTLPERCCIPTPAGLPSGPYRARLLRAGMQEQRSSVRKHSVGISGESQTRQPRAFYAVNLTSALEAPASSITPHPLTPFSTSLHHTGPTLTFVCLWWLYSLCGPFSQDCDDSFNGHQHHRSSSVFIFRFFLYIQL